MNRVALMGRVVRDIELISTNNHKKYVRFTLAVPKKVGKEEKTDFINCLAWNKTAELISQYVKKGHRLLVEGSILTGIYNRPSDGTKVYTTDILVEKTHFVETKQSSSEIEQSKLSKEVETEPIINEKETPNNDFDTPLINEVDDLPF